MPELATDTKAPAGLKKGRYRIWQDFELELIQDLILEPGVCYLLTGANGSGKSSFLKRCLLPGLKLGGYCYLYIGQQLDTQLYVCKADSAFSQSRINVKDGSSMVEYLFERLAEVLAQENPGICYIVLDEYYEYRQVLDYLEDLKISCCLIAVSHASFECSYPVKELSFVPQSLNLSLITNDESLF
ncbi:MAG: hypothetical protein PHI68_05050 [Candidatus Cloacimonetes bacterium]|nr:hypothetical protein [Candidatus Cloacimonadota bacterium]